MTSRLSRLRRSELSTPGSSPKMIAKAAASDADFVFLDLEDAVAPTAKETARDHIVAGLNDLDWGHKTRACRVNGVSTEWCYDDIVQVVSATPGNLDVIILPKVKTPREVHFVDDLLLHLERKLGLKEGHIGLELLIEETEALSCVEAIAACSTRLEALILGVGDLSASMGARAGHIGAGAITDPDLTYPGDMWHHARVRLIVAARANGLDPIDGPFGTISDPDAYRREATWAATLGAVGKWCIHPSQVTIANDIFAPTPAEIEHAHAALNAAREAEEQGLGAANLNGIMIDAATTRIFQAVLDHADRCGLTQPLPTP
jgi:citrate lyase subunit beta/citryl-CoA lyase